MRTHFRAEHLADAALAAAEKNLRACVHCGMCTATCPTYVLLGDERDGPRGRIVMMQKMLEEHAAPSAETVTHLDRCLSCLGCRTACPSGVDYARLIDRSRAHIEQHYRRPVGERLLRWTIANVLTRPALTRLALRLARLTSPLRPLLPLRLRSMVESADAMPIGRLHLPAAAGERRIALLPGCVQRVMAPDIDEAAARLLARRRISVVPLEGAGCCGALPHHLGRENEARMWAKRMIETFERAPPFEGVLITATGCASHINEYEYLFLDDPDWRSRARAVSEKLLPLEGLLGPPHSRSKSKLRVALQVPCSQQHGLRWPDASALLQASGFEVLQIPDGHLCCGSAGSYSILQPKIASALRAGKLANILAVKPDVVATTNIGCLQHLSGPDAPPIVHVAALLDWAEGGPPPRAFGGRVQLMTTAQPAR
ncbi:MAG: glycolate oxidase subunit GlcF [Rhizomicrobium sp.]